MSYRHFLGSIHVYEAEEKGQFSSGQKGPDILFFTGKRLFHQASC
jgi:hypothetical protein